METPCFFSLEATRLLFFFTFLFVWNFPKREVLGSRIGFVFVLDREKQFYFLASRLHPESHKKWTENEERLWNSWLRWVLCAGSSVFRICTKDVTKRSIFQVSLVFESFKKPGHLGVRLLSVVVSSRMHLVVWRSWRRGCSRKYAPDGIFLFFLSLWSKSCVLARKASPSTWVEGRLTIAVVLNSKNKRIK